MTTATPHAKRRILVVDDNPAIHEDFKKILPGDSQGSSDLLAAERLLLGEPEALAPRPTFEIDSALQGQAGVERVKQSLAEGRPYAMAFVDMRMPPGWDGLETIENLWREVPDLQIVICTAYSDHEWNDI